MLKAVIFDMDGTLLDSETLQFKATKKLFKYYGVKIKLSDVKPYFGRGAHLYIKNLIKKHKIKRDLETLIKKRREYAREIAKKGVRVFPGILRLISELKKNKIKLALATSASSKSMNTNLKYSKINKNMFKIITTNNNIIKVKPDPEIFLLTMKKLKVNPEECIIIEDSIAGVEAGKRAKAIVIAITNSFPKSKLKKANLIVSSAEEINIKKLKSIIKWKKEIYFSL